MGIAGKQLAVSTVGEGVNDLSIVARNYRCVALKLWKRHKHNGMNGGVREQGVATSTYSIGYLCISISFLRCFSQHYSSLSTSSNRLSL